MCQKVNPQMIIGCLVILAVILVVGAFVISVSNDTKLAQTDSITRDEAVKRALLYARDDQRIGGIVGRPAEVRGTITTYGNAVQIIYGKGVDPTKDTARMQDSQVWIITLEGSFATHVPAAPDIPAKDITHTQMGLIIDGKTGELIERVFISPNKRVDVSSLPLLPIPEDEVLPVPTKGPPPLESPLSTATPAR